MFESSKKKEPKLVFVHKSSPPPVVTTRPAEPPHQMPRFTVVANGQVKQTKGDENTLQKTVNSVAINSSQKPQHVISINSSGLANQKYEQKVDNNNTGLANQKPQNIVDDKGKEPVHQKIQQTIVVPGNGLASQKPQQIFQQALQPKTEQQSLQKQSTQTPAQQQHNKEQPSSQVIQPKKGPQSQSADVTKEQLSLNVRPPTGLPQVKEAIQNETLGEKIGNDKQAQNKDRNETKPPETSHQGFSKISLVSQDREMQQATITFTEEKTVDTTITAAQTEKPNGHSNVYPPQTFRRDSDATKLPSQSTQDPKNNPANQITEKFEGFSIYRGRQEIPNSKQSISKEKLETVVSTMQNSPSTVNNSAKSFSAATVVTSSPASTPNSDDDPVTLRHPKSAVAMSPAQKQPAPAPQPQKQHQQYQRTHQLLQAHPQAVVIDSYRQGDYGYQTVPHMRVYSYPQAVRQPSAKAIRLAGPYIQEHVYQQHPAQRHAPSTKTRSFSASSAPHVRYPGGTAQWQASPTQGYYVYTEDSNTIPRAMAGSTETSHVQDAASYKPPQVSNGQRPKSILKSPSLPEAPPEWWHNNARPMKLPRPQSMLNPSPNKRDFDFSSILTANSDIVSYTKHPHHHGWSPSQSQTQASRPVSAGSILQRPEAPQEGTAGTPQRKSVTFNSQVRLHTEDRVSIVTPLVVDS